ncbi:MAG: hypothetical protein J6S21_04180 [Victivallales bacterium]|nr:hypothetical protein [Victivallales bacterium]
MLCGMFGVLRAAGTGSDAEVFKAFTVLDSMTTEEPEAECVPEEVLPRLKMVISRWPEESRIYRLMANLFDRMYDREEVGPKMVEFITPFLEKFPEELELQICHIRSLFFAARFEESREGVRRMMAENPKQKYNPDLLEIACYSSRVLEDWDDLKRLDEYIAAAPSLRDNVLLGVLRLDILGELKKTEELRQLASQLIASEELYEWACLLESEKIRAVLKKHGETVLLNGYLSKVAAGKGLVPEIMESKQLAELLLEYLDTSLKLEDFRHADMAVTRMMENFKGRDAVFAEAADTVNKYLRNLWNKPQFQELMIRCSEIRMLRNGRTPGNLQQAALAYASAGKYRQALALIESVPVGSLSRELIRMEALWMLKEYDRLIEVCRAVEQNDEPEVMERVFLYYGMAAAYKGDYALAVEKLKEARRLAPENHNVANTLAYTMAEAGVELEEADKHIRFALAGEPESYSFLDTLAWLRFREGRIPEALEAMAKTLEHCDVTTAILREDHREITEHAAEILRRAGYERLADALDSEEKKAE